MKFNKVDVTGSIRIQRLSTAQRIAIISPPEGRLVFDTDDNNVYVGDGSAWNLIGSGGGGGGGTANLEVESFITGTPSGNYTGGTTTFELDVFSYTPGSTEIMVFANNLLMKLGVDYTEHPSGAQIDFVAARAASEPVCVYKIADSGIGGAFTDLNDTPADYTGQALKVVSVNAGETGLEFTNPAGAGGLPTILTTDNTTGGSDIEISAGDSIIAPAGQDINLTPPVGQAVNINGKLMVSGLIDPTGLELNPNASNPGGVPANTLWLDSLDSDQLKLGSSRILNEADLPSLGTGNVTVQVYSANDTWVKPANLKAVKVYCTGGGGAGGGVSSGQRSATGGAAGGTAIAWIDEASLGANETITIGSGGIGTTGNGPTGGTSSFGAHCSATGGAGGQGNYGLGNHTFTTGGIGSGGDLNMLGGSGGAGHLNTFTEVGVTSGAGGASYWGGGGNHVETRSNSITAADGAAPGSGGGASAKGNGSGTATGGDGADGIIVVEEYF
jgi:hypothetical protein